MKINGGSMATEQRRPRRANLRRKDVEHAMNELIDDGQVVTVHAIWEHLDKRGSLATISALKKEIEEDAGNPPLSGGADAMLAALRSEIRKELDADYAKLVEAADERLDDAESMVADAESRMSAMRERSEKDEQRIGSLTEELNRRASENSRLAAEVDHHKAIAEERAKTAATLTARIDALSETFEALVESVTSSSTEVNRLAGIVESSRADLVSSTDDIVSVTKASMESTGRTAKAVNESLSVTKEIAKSHEGLKEKLRTQWSRLDGLDEALRSVDAGIKSTQALSEEVVGHTQELSKRLSTMMERFGQIDALVEQVKVIEKSLSSKGSDSGSDGALKAILPQLLETVSDIQNDLLGFEKAWRRLEKKKEKEAQKG
jgi:chromosome segregation ATPase